MKNAYLLSFILLVFFFACNKETRVVKYDLSTITGTYTGIQKVHWLYQVGNTHLNGDTAYNTSVTVNDVNVDGKFFSVGSDYFMWLDSTHTYYPFDTSFRRLPLGICFSRGGDSIFITQGSSVYPNYYTYFVGVK